jgi:hypothetical protein
VSVDAGQQQQQPAQLYVPERHLHISQQHLYPDPLGRPRVRRRRLRPPHRVQRVREVWMHPRLWAHGDCAGDLPVHDRLSDGTGPGELGVERVHDLPGHYMLVS